MTINNIVKSSAILLFCTMTIAGCTSIPQTKQSIFHIDGIDLLSRPATDQLIVFQTPDDDEFLCLVSSPDAIPTHSDSISTGVSGVDIGFSENSGAGILGGRDRAVLLARDLLYRTCEFSLNYHLEKEEAKELYMKTLKHIETISIAHISISEE
jgi:hypothetical protein